MAKFQVSCPNCDTRYQVDAALRGRRAQCKTCEARFLLADPEAHGSGESSLWPWVSRTSSTGSVPSLVPRSDGRGGDGVPEIWRPGDVILDLYQVLEVFTTGGRGLVYRVRHKGWNIDLAVKCPRPEFFLNEQDKEDFEREAETWVKLGVQRHTVTCYYVRRLGGIPRVFAEFVEGGSLAGWIRSRRFYRGAPEAVLLRILDVAIQMAWGLHHAHEQGLVHRDVKPDNVLLTSHGVAKVTDFGMARARGAAAGTAPAGGDRSVLVSAGGMTLAFCSPEQIEGKPVSRKTDVWSWGVSVLEMFTGSANWAGGYLAAEVLKSYREGGLAPDRLPRMPLALAELLACCFRRDPEERPRGMREVVAVLREIYREAAGKPYPREAPFAAEALADSLNNRAVSLLDLDKQREAERLWEDALAADPNHLEATYNLGLFRWRAGRMTEEALREKIREAGTSQAEAWLPLYMLAQVHLDAGHWQAAVETLGNIGGADRERDEVRLALAAARDRLAASEKPVMTFTGHSDWVSSAALSADGRLALSGSADKTLRLWETATGRCLGTWPGHTEWVTAVSLSPDGRLALSGSADKTLRLWEAATGMCLATWAGHARWVLAVAFTPDDRLALSGGGDDVLILWDVATGASVRRFTGHRGPVLAVALSPDGRLALSGSRDGTLKLWEVASGQCVRTLAGHGDRVLAVDLSVDGRLAVSGSADRNIKLWDVDTGHCIRTLEGHAGGVLAVALSNDGRHVVSGGEDRTVKYWRLAGGRCLVTLAGHANTVNAVCLSAAGRHALSGSADGTLALWSLKEVAAPYMVSRVLSSESVLTARADYQQFMARAWQALSAGDSVTAARCIREARAVPGYSRTPEAMNQWAALYTRQGRRGLAGGWESTTFEGHTDAVTAAAWSGNGRYALSASADGTLRLWEAASGQCLRTVVGHEDAVTAVCWDGPGRHALSGSVDRTARLWDVASGRCLLTFEGHADAVTAVAWCADGRLALTGSADRTLKLWEVSSGHCLRTLEGHADPVQAVCFSADGYRALSGAAQFLVRHENERLFTSGQLLLWDVAAGRCLQTFGNRDAVTSVALSADGRLVLASGGQSVIQTPTGKLVQSAQLQLWDGVTGQCLLSLAGHGGAVTSVCMGLGGRFALSGATDRTLRLWELAGGQCLRTFAGHGDAVTSVALSPDGRYALSGSADRTLKLWVLDWEIEENPPAAWDEGARPYLANFLTLHTPFAARLPKAQKRTGTAIVYLPIAQLFKPPAVDEALTRALTRRGKPTWTEEDFEGLLHVLGCAGFGWLRPEGVRRQLEEMASAWESRPLPAGG